METSVKRTNTTVRTAFGIGGAPIGVVQNGLAYFLLIYYNQVLGLDPGLAGFALSLALVFDAVTEALIGNGQKENPISSAISHDNCTVIQND